MVMSLLGIPEFPWRPPGLDLLMYDALDVSNDDTVTQNQRRQ